LDVAAFDDIEFSSSFQLRFRSKLAESADVELNHVVINNILEGSVLVESTVYFFDAPVAGLEIFADMIQNQPSDALSDDFFNRFGEITSLSVAKRLIAANSTLSPISQSPTSFPSRVPTASVLVSSSSSPTSASPTAMNRPPLFELSPQELMTSASASSSPSDDSVIMAGIIGGLAGALIVSLVCGAGILWCLNYRAIHRPMQSKYSLTEVGPLEIPYFDPSVPSELGLRQKHSESSMAVGGTRRGRRPYLRDQDYLGDLQIDSDPLKRPHDISEIEESADAANSNNILSQLMRTNSTSSSQGKDAHKSLHQSWFNIDVV